METWARTSLVTGGQHIVGNEMLDDMVTLSRGRHERQTVEDREPHAVLRASVPAFLSLPAG
jgi:hypothetical protein